MTESGESVTKQTYLCPNCRAKRSLDHHGHGGPLCPECRVEEMAEMRRPECGECDSTTFQILDSPKAGVHGPDPMIECTACGWTGRIDEDGVWY